MPDDIGHLKSFKMSRKIFYSPNTFQSYGDPEINAVLDYIRENPIDDKEAVAKFENRIASLFKMKHGVFVNSGSSANLLGYIALGFGEGSKVITPACTFPTTISPLIFLKSKIVFSDIDQGRFVPSVDQVMELVKDDVTGISIADLVGDKFDFEELKKRLHEIGRDDIKILEDACDTLTTSVADVATVSFYASHLISAGGCGGMALTNDDAIAEKMRKIRQSNAWDFSAPSFCAVFGYVNSLKVDELTAKRHENILHYYERLKDNSFYELPKCLDDVWLSMALIVKSHRFEIVRDLEEMGIQTRLVMAGNILRQPFYQKMFPEIHPENFPNTEVVFRRGILLGLHQGILPEDVDFICDKLIELSKKYDS